MVLVSWLRPVNNSSPWVLIGFVQIPMVPRTVNSMAKQVNTTWPSDDFEGELDFTGPNRIKLRT
jgi:hypothetical protein